MKQKRSIILGLDGGGTKTVCVAVPLGTVEDARTPLARVVVGSTNWNSVGVDQARANLKDAVDIQRKPFRIDQPLKRSVFESFPPS